MEDALNIYKEAVALDNRNFKTYEYLGWAYQLDGKHEAALENLNNAIEIVKDNCA